MCVVALCRAIRISLLAMVCCCILPSLEANNGAGFAAVVTAADTTATPVATPAPTNSADELEFFVVKADTIWVTPPVEVVGSRVPAALPGVVRTVEVRDADDLAKLPGRSAAEFLQTVPGVVVNQRQQYGVQADLTARGSTFEQVLLLLDGFDASDPQTGHFALDLPLAVQDIKRLEVLPGHGSALYGSGAFGGTVNVVTRRPARGTGGAVAIGGGGNGTWTARGSVDIAFPRTKDALREAAQASGDDHPTVDRQAEITNRGTGLRFSLDRFKTDGDDVRLPDGSTEWSGRDADNWAATGRLLSAGDHGEADLFVGYGDRAFGAQDFYAPVHSYEHTQVLATSGRWRTAVSDAVTVEPRLFFRRHRDRFWLYRDEPARYFNDSVTRRALAELRSIIDLGGQHAVALSCEGAYEDIDSEGIRLGLPATALGSHLRRRLSLAAELARNADPLRWQFGLRLDTRSLYAPRLSGSVAADWTVASGVALRASAGTVFRVPTFTELYYEDPYNRGNPDLQPERGWAWDVGVTVTDGPWQARVTYFDRYETDLIDWARPIGSTDPWQVMNIADGNARGIETLVAWAGPRGDRLSASYAYLHKTNDLSSGYEAKYSLIAPRHQLILGGTAALRSDLFVTLTGRYLEHTGGPEDFQSYFVLDGRIAYRTGRWTFSYQVTNLGNVVYAEVPGVQMPGLLMTATVERRF